MVTVGVGAMVTVVESERLPPGPVQFRVNVLLLLIGPTLSLPDIAFDPLHAPEAVQELALVEDQLSVV